MLSKALKNIMYEVCFWNLYIEDGNHVIVCHLPMGDEMEYLYKGKSYCENYYSVVKRLVS